MRIVKRVDWVCRKCQNTESLIPWGTSFKCPKCGIFTRVQF